MRSRRLRRVLAGAACAAAAMTSVTACGIGYGADFDYPGAPPVPPGGTVVESAKGSDDDDPMRGREAVIETARGEHADLVAFYRERFPAADGWEQGTPEPDVGGGHLLCLVSHAEGYDEYVEIYPSDGGSPSAGGHRYLASVSRLHAPEGERTVDQCGLARAWYPSSS